MLRHRLITGTLLVAALLGLLWVDGAVSARMHDDAAVVRLLGTSDGLALTALALLVLAPVLGAELAAMLRGAGVAAPRALTALAAVAGCAAVRCVPGVSTLPGATALARMRGASSRANALVSMTTPPFDAA